MGLNACRQGLFVSLFLLHALLFAAPPHSFQHAKRIANTIFAEHRVTLYCHCAFDATNQIDLASCEMEQAANKKRANRVEFEHMLPAENLGRQFPCWREPLCESKGKPYKGRRCCSKIDARFKQAEAELYNLWPAEGIVNQARSNYRYGEVAGKTGIYGCMMHIDKAARKAEPSDNIKGLVARANLFMADKYKIRLSKPQRQLLEGWDKLYPPDEWERAWAMKIAAIEGYENAYITQRG